MFEPTHGTPLRPERRVTHIFRTEAVPESELRRRIVLHLDLRPVARETMSQWLSSRLGDYSVESVGTVEDALAVIGRSDEFSLVLYNIGARCTDRGSLAKEIEPLVGNPRQVPVAILADIDDVTMVVAALECGARGFIPSSLPAEVMVEAMRLICAGDVYAPAPTLMRQVTQQKRGSAGGVGANGKELLSPRQVQIVECLRSGMSNKRIAINLGMSPGTVKVHLRNIMRKLDVNNRTQVVLTVAAFPSER